MNNRKLIFFWIGFVGIIFSIYLSTEIIVPKEFKYLEINGQNETKLKFDFHKNNTLEFDVGGISYVNQFLLTRLRPVFSNESLEFYHLIIDFEYKVLDHKNNIMYSDVYTFKHTYDKEKFLAKKAQQIHLPYIFNFRENDVRFALTINNPDKVKTLISEFEVRVETNNESFFRFFLNFKIILFIISIFTFSTFLKRYLIQLRQTREVEQKLILTISVLLVLYNFPFNFYVNSLEPSISILMISSLVNVVFYSYICYIWMVLFEVG